MKNSQTLAVILMLFVFSFTKSYPQSSVKDLPFEILNYYDDFNLINLLSTSEEQQMLTHITINEFDQKYWKSHRLKRVFDAINRIKRLEMKTDPDISIKMTPKIDTLQPKRSTKKLRVPSSPLWARVIRVNKRRHKITIDLELFGLDVTEQQALISKYDKEPFDLPELPKLSPLVPLNETHYWFHVENSWKKKGMIGLMLKTN